MSEKITKVNSIYLEILKHTSKSTGLKRNQRFNFKIVGSS